MSICHMFRSFWCAPVPLFYLVSEQHWNSSRNSRREKIQQSDSGCFGWTLFRLPEMGSTVAIVAKPLFC